MLVKESEAAKKAHEHATRGGLRVDYIGFAFVAIGLGCLQVVLDKGQEDDWSGSTFITVFAILSAIGIIGGILWELLGTDHPIVDLPLLRERSFAFTNLMMFVTMFVLLTTTQLLPQFVQEILPYDATKAGLLLMPGGLVLMALMPLVGFLVRKDQPKYLIAFGFLVCALAMYHLAGFEPGASFKALALARVLQAVGLAFLFVPIQTIAYANLPQEKSNNASALINLMRNLGGSVGISLGTTLLARRAQVHQDRLVAHLTPTALPFQTVLHDLASRLHSMGLDSATALKRATAVLARNMELQAAMLSYLDIFMVLMYGSLIAAALTTFLRKIKLGRGRAH